VLVSIPVGKTWRRGEHLHAPSCAGKPW
jgi:hypothetical protein